MFRNTLIKERWYLFVGFILVLSLLFSTNLPVTGRSASQEGISQPQAFSTSGSMNFQGQLTDQGGNPINGSYNLRFAIFDATSAGTKKWPSTAHEQHTSIVVNNGLISVQLGSVGDIIRPTVFNEGGNRYLQVWVCKTAGAGCTDYDDMGRLEISSSASAQSLVAPAFLEVSGYNEAITGKTVNGIGVFGWATASTGDAFGVYGISASSFGTGVYGFATASTGVTNGVYGSSASSFGRGVYGDATATTGSALGVYGRSASTSGSGVYGVATATTGTTEGVNGSSASSGGAGVHGAATATTGSTHGVYGISSSNSGTGVYGGAKASTGTTYGVYGSASSNSGYAGYFAGRLHTSGNFTASGTKSFIIDHPLDPENQYLYHYSMEGPEPYTIYRGTVILDENGSAWVDLPDYFEALNVDYNYQLTPIGKPMPNLFIAEGVVNNRFLISGGESGFQVSWVVTALRNDPWVRDQNLQAEVLKTESQTGTFLYPQGYGLPEEFGVDYNPDMMTDREDPTVNE